MRILLASAFLVLSAGTVVACGGMSPHATSATAAFKAPGEAAMGDNSHCPVSGEAFVVSAESPKVEHDGKTYYFCCGGCAKKFQADPAKFIAKLKKS